MACTIVAVFLTDNSLAQQACPSMLSAYLGGQLITLPSAGRIPTKSADLTIRLQYCKVLTSDRGGLFSVRPTYAVTFLDFLKKNIQILNELKTTLICRSPNEPSMRRAQEIVAGLLESGMRREEIYWLDVENQFNQQDDVSAPQAAEEPLISRLTMPAVASLAEAQRLKMPIASTLHRATDFEAELVRARHSYAEDNILRAIASRVITQRSLLRAENDFKQLIATLELPCITSHEWLQENQRLLRKESPAPSNKHNATGTLSPVH